MYFSQRNTIYFCYKLPAHSKVLLEILPDYISRTYLNVFFAYVISSLFICLTGTYWHNIFKIDALISLASRLSEIYTFELIFGSVKVK